MEFFQGFVSFFMSFGFPTETDANIDFFERQAECGQVGTLPGLTLQALSDNESNILFCTHTKYYFNHKVFPIFLAQLFSLDAFSLTIIII